MLGSQSPKDLVALFGFDIEDETFWELGIMEIEAILGEFKRMCGMIDQMLGSYDFQTLMRRHATELVEMLLVKGFIFQCLPILKMFHFHPYYQNPSPKDLSLLRCFF